MKLIKNPINQELRENVSAQKRHLVFLPWWPSCLDRGALNNVDAPGCGTSVVRGPTGHK